ncbi:type II restriction/modification enzyme [Campylobacter peloridis]|uniref:Type-2 restriction enzyme n=1 Tax=Campylobacter peloridis TaxID=488546 RepID=A0ABX6TUE7_9BACT|nr:type II restriction/modification enzyme [Campylobacter peloridis]AJC83975.1 type II restriction endonuclease, DpnII family [Campylobacter peloridis LMG 23910]QOQ89568.1 type II restriction/modification enzyme [Campylobacter peloridis]
MKNELSFEKFINSLQATNRHLDFYVDWEKCLRNKNKISIYLNHLNFLLGKSENELRQSIEELFEEYPKAFNVLNVLIAVRDKDKKDIVINQFSNFVSLEGYFKNSDSVYNFICETGLLEIFSTYEIKNLNDYVFGIEVGLDTNARKNRSGKIMEMQLKEIFTPHCLKFEEQVNIKKFPELHKAFGEDIKKFDFVIFASKKTYFIECNFYAGAGSKLNEVARAYQELAPKFDRFSQYEFIWITDGQGWLKAKNKLEEAYKKVEIYNLSNINDFILKVKNV